MLTSETAATAAVWVETADRHAVRPDAVTTTRMVKPASAGVTVYVRAAAPGIEVQAPFSQRCHWYVYVSGPVPFQVPFVAVST